MNILILWVFFFIFLDSSKANTELLVYTSESDIPSIHNLDFPKANSFDIQINKVVKDTSIFKSFFVEYDEIHGLELIRCRIFSDYEKTITNFTIPSISEYDNFGENFEQLFRQKAFLIKNKRNIESVKLLNVCKGIKLEREEAININRLFSERIYKVLKQEYLNFNFSAKYAAKVELNLNEIVAIHIQSNTNGFKLDLNFFKNANNSFSIVKVNDGSLYEAIINESNQINYVQKKSEQRKPQVSYLKEIKGAGLHQSISLKIELELDTDQIRNGKECNLIIQEHLPDNSYIDIEEFLTNKNYEIHTFNVVDIEKPSTVSFQHVFFLKKKLNESEIKKEASQIMIDATINYPIHFRYRRPSNSTLYKGAKLNDNPRFYLDCVRNKDELESEKKYVAFYDQFVSEHFSNAYVRLKNKEIIKNIIIVDVPTGDSNLLNVVLLITLALTISAAGYVSILIIKKKVD